jgi:hypothetical protein
VIGLLVPASGYSHFISGDWNLPEDIRTALDGVGFDFIEVVPQRGVAFAVYFGETARFHRGPYNRLATEFMGGPRDIDDFIAGPALITGFDRATGVARPIPTRQLIRLAGLFVKAEHGPRRKALRGRTGKDAQ